MRHGLLMLALLAVAPGVFAQDAAVSSQSSSTTMAELIKQGYEIKAAVPNGSKFIVFLQKENSAYACEFASLQNSRCGSIN